MHCLVGRAINKEKEVVTMARMYRMGTALFWSKLDGDGVAVLGTERKVNERVRRES